MSGKLNDDESNLKPNPLLINDYEITLLYGLTNFSYGDVRHGIEAAINYGINSEDLADIVRDYNDGSDQIITNYNQLISKPCNTSKMTQY